MFFIVARLKRRARDDAAQVTLDERHSRALDRDIGSCTHRDPDVSLRERRGVVDAIAGHGGPFASLLETFDDRDLLIGKHIGFDVIDANRHRHGFSRGAVVSGHHDDLEALPMQVLDGFHCRRLDRVGDADQSGGLAADRHEHHGLAAASTFVRSRPQYARIDAERCHETEIADRDATAIDDARHSLPVIDSNSLTSASVTPPLQCTRHDRRSQRVLADVFEAGGQPQQRGLINVCLRAPR